MSKQSKHNLSVFIAGILMLSIFFYILCDVNTRFCQEYSDSSILTKDNFNTLYSLNSVMQISETIDDLPERYIAEKHQQSLTVLEGTIKVDEALLNPDSPVIPRLYIPSSLQNCLAVNGHLFTAEPGHEYITCSLSECIDNSQTADPVEFSLRLYMQPNDNASVAESLIYIGASVTINRLISAASFQRFFVIGISFMVLLYSLSLYMEKRSEKYLLFLSLLSYTTTARTLWNAIPVLKNMVIPNILLLGTIPLPGVSGAVSFYVSYILLKFIIAYMRILLLREFIGVKSSRKNYLILYTILLAALIPFCFSGSGYLASHIFILATHFVEFVMIVFGRWKQNKACFTLVVAWCLTVALRIFDMLCSYGFLTHGMIDAGIKLQGIVETFFTLAFVVVINLKFAHKYEEADRLAVSLEEMNQNLESLVAERTAELTERNSELSDAYRQLNDIQVQKSEFMSNIIHNLKTPLFSLYGYADMAMDEIEDAPELAKKHLEEINKNTSYAKQLIDNLFLCMRLEDGKVQYQKMPYPVSMLLSQLESTSNARAQASGINIIFTKPHPDTVLSLDLLYVRQALQNIVDNAIRHSSPGTNISLYTTTETRNNAEYLAIHIDDEGEGIPENELPLIFGRYYSKGKNGASSSGLGLTITKEIIEQHQGFIEVNSCINEGTRFTVFLPLNADQL